MTPGMHAVDPISVLYSRHAWSVTRCHQRRLKKHRLLLRLRTVLSLCVLLQLEMLVHVQANAFEPSVYAQNKAEALAAATPPPPAPMR